MWNDLSPGAIFYNKLFLIEYPAEIHELYFELSELEFYMIDSFPGVSSLTIVDPVFELKTIVIAWAAVVACFWSFVSNFSTATESRLFGFGKTTKFILS